MDTKEILTTMKHATIKESERVFKEMADRLEDLLLGYNNEIPKEYFDLFKAIFSDSDIVLKNGVWHFAQLIYNERGKLTKAQKNDLLEIFKAEFLNYTEKDLSLFVCDFIARVYEPELAIEAFEKMGSVENQLLRPAVLVGLEIILRNEGLAKPVYTDAENLYHRLLRANEQNEPH